MTTVNKPGLLVGKVVFKQEELSLAFELLVSVNMVDKLINAFTSKVNR
jgi:hypothetical protein